jgi:prepilin-type N-terminal cleavage/methylation domain-containing protein
MKFNHQNIIKAFTLSEVLIVLVIIGVVSSLVIPSIINDTQDAELNVALKKTYAELSQATNLIIQDNGGTFAGVISTDTDRAGLVNAYAEHLSYIKLCNNVARTQGCWHPLSTNGGTWKKLNGENADDFTAGSGIILKNGAMVSFYPFKRDCTYMGGYYTKPYVCAWVIMDVNGFKMPNTEGKDVFHFNLLYNKLEPWGAPNSLEQTCETITAGLYCTAPKLMQ